MKALRKGILCLLALMLILVPTSTAFALEEVGIEIRYAHGACTFDFYKLADYAEGEGFVPAAPFDRYTDTVPLLLGIEGLTAEETRLLSTTMESVVLRDGIAPTVTAVTADDGVLRLAPIEQGAYLVLGESTTDGQYRYTVLGLPAEPAAENLPMERPVDSFRRWWAELVKYKGARDDVDWLFESVICPHFCPQKSENTQNARDKGE